MPITAVSAPAPTPLRLHPFRAVRYDADRVGDPSVLLAPPFDDLGPARARALRRVPHHIARLLHAHDSHAAARELQHWLRRGVLRRDEQPAIYLYQQQRGARILQRGLIGDLLLPHRGTAAAGRVLPHEDVSAAVVRQRAAHMAGLRAQLEPLLLAYRGTGSTAAQAMEHISRRVPVLVACTGDITHTLWACDDEEDIALVTSGLAGGEALIADGHHRHAACLHLRGDGHPWSSTLALLVDSTTHPLGLSAIHRVLPGLEPEKAAMAAAEVAHVQPLPGGPRPPEPGELVLVGVGQSWTITEPDPQALDEALAGQPQEWAALPAAVSDQLLIRHAWSVPDLPGAVRHHHDIGRAVAAVAGLGGGSALLLPTMNEETVWELSRREVLLPRKSTSFGPKPVAGMALRVLGLS